MCTQNQQCSGCIIETWRPAEVGALYDVRFALLCVASFFIAPFFVASFFVLSFFVASFFVLSYFVASFFLLPFFVASFFVSEVS